MNIRKPFFWSLIILFVVSAVPSLKAQGTTPFQLSLFNPVQISNEKTTVKGFRLNLIYGKNRGMNGLDIGFINHVGNKTSTAVQFGFANYTEADFTGVQFGGVHWADKKMTGLQWGFLNYSANMNGVQIGIVNYAENMHGLQIGLANIIKKDGAFPFFPIVNWSF